MTGNKQVYTIVYNALDNFGSSIISKVRLYDIVNKVISKNQSTANIINTLKRKNKIIYLFNDYFYILNSDEQIKKYYKYSAEEMVFIILNKLKISWHLGLHSALLINNVNSKDDVFHQVPKTTIIVNSSYSKSIVILNQKFIFKKQTQSREVGINKRNTKNRVTFYYSDLERTYLEYIYYTSASPIAKNILNSNKLEEYLQYFPKTLYNKVNINEK